MDSTDTPVLKKAAITVSQQHGDEWRKNSCACDPQQTPCSESFHFQGNHPDGRVLSPSLCYYLILADVALNLVPFTRGPTMFPEDTVPFFVTED